MRNAADTDTWVGFPAGDQIQMVTGNTQRGILGNTEFSFTVNLVTTGSVSANNYITTSDKKLKENIHELNDDKLKIDWKTYNYIDNKNDYRVGVLAQELEKEHPEFVVTNEEGLKAVKYIDLLCAKVAELEKRIEKLENKN
jgi:hypothetical protein